MVSTVAVEHACRLVRFVARRAAISRVYAMTHVPARREETTDENPERNRGRMHDRHHDDYPPAIRTPVPG